MGATNFGRLTPEQRRYWSRPAVIPGWGRTSPAPLAHDSTEAQARRARATELDAIVASTDRILPRIGLEL